MNINNKIKLTTLVLIPFFLYACVATYRDFPEQMIGKQPESNKQSVMYYKINNFPVLNSGGESSLHSVFKSKTPFNKTKKVGEIPSDGIYCYVDVEYKPLTLPALVFGYLSAVTFTILPAWSTKDGYIVNYHLYIDGEEQEVYDYEITRKFAMWIVLLPVAWVNLMTYSEEEAFEATAYQFFEDAKPILF